MKTKQKKFESPYQKKRRNPPPYALQIYVYYELMFRECSCMLIRQKSCKTTSTSLLPIYRLEGIYHHIGNNNNNRKKARAMQTRLPQKTDIAHWSFVLIIFFVILLRFLLFKLKLNSFFFLRVCNFFKGVCYFVQLSK